MVLVDNLGDQIDDLRPKKFKRPSCLWQFIKNAFLILFFSAIVFVAINLPAYIIIGKFKFAPNLFLFGEEYRANLNSASATGAYKPTQHYPDNSLFIPKIGVSAPVSYDIPTGEIMDKLTEGVVHLKGSAHVGQGGNIFITGHSSNYWWEEGGYNTVFALLPELEAGDEIYLTDAGKLKKYKITVKKEVSKKEVDNYLTSDGEQLTLMTCVPVGTNLKRLLVVATPD